MSALKKGLSSQECFPPVSTMPPIEQTGDLGPVLSVKYLCADAQVKWFRTQAYYDSGAWRGTGNTMVEGLCVINQSMP